MTISLVIPPFSKQYPISIIDLTTPPPKFPSYFNLHNESIFLIFFKIILHLIIIIFAPSFCFRVALVNVYVLSFLKMILMKMTTYDLHSGGNLQFEKSRKLGCVVFVAKHF